MAEISQTIISSIQESASQLTAAISSAVSSIAGLMLSKADRAELTTKANVSSPSFTGGMSIKDLPTSAEGLVAGQLWVDTGNGNIIKVVL